MVCGWNGKTHGFGRFWPVFEPKWCRRMIWRRIKMISPRGETKFRCVETKFPRGERLGRRGDARFRCRDPKFGCVKMPSRCVDRKFRCVKRRWRCRDGKFRRGARLGRCGDGKFPRVKSVSRCVNWLALRGDRKLRRVNWKRPCRQSIRRCRRSRASWMPGVSWCAELNQRRP